MKWLNKLEFVCLDGEFTGLDLDKDRVIELAAVRFTLDEVLDRWETLIYCDHPISEEAAKIHHITPDMLEGKPKIEEILPGLKQFIENAPIVGHAIFHDLNMLQEESKRCNFSFPIEEKRVIDTLRLARSYGDSPNNSLETLARHFNIEIGKTHRAMDDVMLNIGVFRHLVRPYKSLDEIMKLLSRPIQMKYMPLGKYKGRLFTDIPLPYLRWAASMDFDQDLLYSIKQELRKRKQGDGFSQATNPFANL